LRYFGLYIVSCVFISVYNYGLRQYVLLHMLQGHQFSTECRYFTVIVSFRKGTNWILCIITLLCCVLESYSCYYVCVRVWLWLCHCTYKNTGWKLL